MMKQTNQKIIRN